MDSLVKRSAGCCSYSLSRGFWDVCKRFSRPLCTVLTWLSGPYGSASVRGCQKPLPLSTWSFSTLTWLTQMHMHVNVCTGTRTLLLAIFTFDTVSPLDLVERTMWTLLVKGLLYWKTQREGGASWRWEPASGSISITSGLKLLLENGVRRHLCLLSTNHGV